MIQNYLKTSFRNLFRNKGYSFINILGLTVGIATSLFIFLWISDELSYDRFHKNGNRIFNVLINNTYPDGRIETYPATPAKLKAVIESEIPDVELAAHFSFPTELLIKYGDQGFNEATIFSDPTLFKILSFPIVLGNASRPLNDIKSVSMSQRLATKLFNNENPLGKTVMVGQKHELIVTSVFEDIGQNSTLQFDLVASFDLFVQDNPWTQHWQSGANRTVVMLKPHISEEETNRKISNLIKSNCADCTTQPFLFPYTKWRLFSDFNNGVNTGGRIQQVYLFGAVALIILLIACINFMNLSTARSASRSREVGIRKSIGAARSSLVFQFLMDSIILAFIALFFAWIIVQLLLPYFNELTGKSLRLELNEPLFLGGSIVITCLAGLLAGSYPSFVLSGFQAVKVLKGDSHSGLTGVGLRKVLVVVQFSASAILVIGSIAVQRQIDFISKTNLGFEKENILVVDQNEGIVKNFEAIRNELLHLPGVKNIAFGGNNIFTVPITTTDPVWLNKPDNSSISFKIYRCDAQFIPTMNIKMLKGRTFLDRRDSSNYIINRKAAEVMGMSLDDAVGSELEMWNGKGRIVGVTDNFHNDNLKFGIEPLIFMYSENLGLHYFIKLSPQHAMAQQTESIKEIFKKYNPDYPFEYTLLDDVFDHEYQTERVIGKLSLSFTLIAIVISCLGLFGLASFTAERRTKEIGIRKVMGASVKALTLMLCRDFALLVLSSLIIAYPVAWYLIREYLASYSFHTEINFVLYLLTGVVMLLLTVLSVGFQSIKAATSNPVESLRSE